MLGLFLKARLQQRAWLPQRKNALGAWLGRCVAGDFLSSRLSGAFLPELLSLRQAANPPRPFLIMQLILFGIIAGGLVTALLRMRRRDPKADFAQAAIATLNSSARVRARVGSPLTMVGRFQGKAGFNAVDGVLAAKTPLHPLVVVELTAKWSRPLQGWQFSKLHLVEPAHGRAPANTATPDTMRPDGFVDGARIKVV